MGQEETNSIECDFCVFHITEALLAAGLMRPRSADSRRNLCNVYIYLECAAHEESQAGGMTEQMIKY